MNDTGEAKRIWTLYVIHHSHTDIGYTDRQEKIERSHVHFIKQAIEAVERAGAGDFRWTCETFWPVERFLACASDAWRDRLVRALQSGHMELSANYLNMTELIDGPLMRRLARRAGEFGKSVGIEVDCAMTADINGYSWGYADALLQAGVQHLFSCVHTHHGMYPVRRKQIPFWWQAESGEKLLVWNGEHYHFGNELGIVPENAEHIGLEQAEERISAYVRQLDEENYPYDFAPAMVSGAFTDNGPPNPAISRFIERWNREHGHRVNIRMATLGEFFKVVRQAQVEIPVYRGDWPDWWSDGVGSTPVSTQMFRDAQRKLDVLRRLDSIADRKNSNPKHTSVIEAAEQNLALYAEHTWGHSSSVHQPWTREVHALAARKSAYASVANRLVYTVLDEVLEEQGEAMIRPGRAKLYCVVNPFAVDVDDVVPLLIDHWESSFEYAEVVDVATGASLPCQSAPSSRGTNVFVRLQLAPGEKRTLQIQAGPRDGYRPSPSVGSAGSDGVSDVRLYPVPDLPSHVIVNEGSIETDFVRLRWEPEKGIVSWYDKLRKSELIHPGAPHGALTPVYEVTPPLPGDNMMSVRRKLGRNRKGMNVVRDAGRLSGIRILQRGVLFTEVQFDYEIEGCRWLNVVLTVYTDMPRIDARVRAHKESRWEPESLYLSLPFTIGENEQLWIDKAGALVRPHVDQLPGTLTDFYCVQTGAVYIEPNAAFSIATPDTPLIHIGTLEHRERALQGDPDVDRQPLFLYSWMMNNIWETNFHADLGGFYEFCYHFQWSKELTTANEAMQRCQALNAGLVSFRVTD